MSNWRPAHRRGADYDKRFEELASSGVAMHGEADFVERQVDGRPSRILDAGCGTGRVAIELARRGHDVVGVDADTQMIDTALTKDTAAVFGVADLSMFELGDLDPFDVVLLAGNVMIFVAPGTEAEVTARCASALRPGGLLISGFSLRPDGYTFADHDRHAVECGLELVDRFATWDGEAFDGGDYAVNVFAASPG